MVIFVPRGCREKAAKALEGIVGVAALDADEHKQLAGVLSTTFS